LRDTSKTRQTLAEVTTEDTENTEARQKCANLSGTSSSLSWGRKESQKPWHFRCRVKGIVRRDREWWYKRTFKGVRRWFNLETNDVSEALERKQDLLDSLSLARNDSLELDCTRSSHFGT
jgi:hypothetical protein